LNNGRLTIDTPYFQYYNLYNFIDEEREMVNPKEFLNNQAMLRKAIEDYLLNNKPRLHKQKQKCGELPSYLDLLTSETTKTARNLIVRGMLETEAWNHAIRYEISRTENQ
jgi:hypothetical protein